MNVLMHFAEDDQGDVIDLVDWEVPMPKNAVSS